MPNELPETSPNAAAPPDSGGAPAPASGQPPASARPGVWEAIWPLLLIAATALLALFLTSIIYGGFGSGESIGYWIGWLLLPLIIGWLVSRKQAPPRRLKVFSICFAAVGLFGSLATFSAQMQNHRQPVDPKEAQKEVVGIIKEAAGTQPANSSSASVAGKDLSALIRHFFRQVMDLRKKHEQDAEQFAGALGQLYTVKSFSSPASMRQSIQAVDGIQKIDQDFADDFGKLLNEMKIRAQASSLSESEKEGFMSGLNKGLANSETIVAWKGVQKTEGEWATANHAFYTFTLNRSSAIKTQNEKVVIADAAIREEFNKRLHECAGLRKQLGDANEIMAKTQQAAMKDLGVSESDLGLKK